MLHSEPESAADVALNYKSSRGKFLKAGARLTILSVLSNKVKSQSASLRNIAERAKQQDEVLGTNSKIQNTQTINPPKHDAMTSRSQHEDVVVTEDMGMVNGSTADINGNEEQEPCSEKEKVVSEKVASTTRKLERNAKKGKTPFDFMTERKLSEPVLSPRKRANAMSKMTRCHSTEKLRENELPPVRMRELGGYKFYQRTGEMSNAQTTHQKTYRSYSDNRLNDTTCLKRTIEQQKETIANREKYVLQLEKKISYLETESAESKEQMISLRLNVKDVSATLDSLRLEKESLSSEKERLDSAVQSYETDLRELRAANLKLSVEYEHSEQSRRIAIGHLHDKSWDDGCSKGKHSPSRHMEKSEFVNRLNSVKGCLEGLRVDKETLENEQKRFTVLFQENVQAFVGQVRELETKLKEKESLFKKENDGAEGEVVREMEQGEKGSRVDGIGEEEVEGKMDGKGMDGYENGEVGGKEDGKGVEEEEGRDKETDLVAFKDKLKANEGMIDQLANDIRDMEDKKKRLLETRFAMIQGFQAKQEVVDEDLDERSIEELDSEDMSELDENVGELEEIGARKQSYRVTRKIRKLERTLSMDHGVGKLDCIQKLCKKLEDCEQRVQELETQNGDLREENEEVSEEAKYFKYVLSYRGDTMKAQLEREFEAKMASLAEELRVAKETNADASHHWELQERNDALEKEVQRLHEELKSLLMSLPALQESNQRSAGRERTTSYNTNDLDQVVRDLEEKVTQLSEEKEVLLLSLQTLSAQHDTSGESENNDSSFSKSLVIMEKTLRDVENENAQFLETFQRIRDVLEVGEDDDDDDGEGIDYEDNFNKISKVKGEIRKLSEKADTLRSSTNGEEKRMGESSSSCARHEERLSELGREVVRLHEEKKSLLSTIIRLQADPNFTFTEDSTDDEMLMSGRCSSPRLDNNNIIPIDSPLPRAARMMIPITPVAVSCEDKGVQVGTTGDNVEGLLGYLEDDLVRLKTALSPQLVQKRAEMDRDRRKATARSGEPRDITDEIDELTCKVNEFEEHNRALQGRLDESESIRADLHRTIAIATDMASEERLKCADLMESKAALEKDMIKLAKDNQDLRDGLETLSRVRKRRNSRVQYMSLASPSSSPVCGEGAADASANDSSSLYLPIMRPASRCSESEYSDMDVATPDGKC